MLLAKRVGPTGRVIALDVDPANVAFAREALSATDTPFEVIHGNFTQAKQVLSSLGVNRVNVLLADLGFASNQMDDPARGFAFSTDGPLDMRLNPTLTQTAADLINDLPERELADLIYEYGEERLSRKIARKIAETRERTPIQNTTELAQLVRQAYGRSGSRGRIDPATRTFMALRIAVNHELEALDGLLAALPALVHPGGRAAVISFHSLEDRRVKRAMLALDQRGLAHRLTRKPVVADDHERHDNPRSRSAKLRAVKMIASDGPMT